MGKVETMEVLSFKLRGKMGHYRQPDTTITQGTYPFPPRPTLLGLLGAILGLDYNSAQWQDFLEAEHFLGLKLLAPVRTVCMQMSLLGKGFMTGGGKTAKFNRPTVMEMVVEPNYQIYYTGENLGDLREKLSNRHSVFHTYLGSAFCLTFPLLEGVYEATPVLPHHGTALAVSSVVPREIVERVELTAPAAYAAARAMPHHHRGDRTFKGTCTLFYEVSGNSLKIILDNKTEFPYRLVSLPSGEVICLW